MGKRERKLVTYDEAVNLINDFFQNDPVKSGRNVICKKTLQNAVCSKKLTNYGIRKKFCQLDSKEILRLYGGTQAA